MNSVTAIEVALCAARAQSGNDGQLQMTHVQTKPRAARTRLVVAVFESGEDLARAVMELCRRGFVREQMGIVALLSSLSRMRRSIAPIEVHAAEVAALLGETGGDVLPAVSADRVVVTRGLLWQCLCSLATVVDDAPTTAPWITAQLRDDLATYIRAGAVVFGISANSIDQQRESTRMLLQHSSYRVQTHEFTS